MLVTAGGMVVGYMLYNSMGISNYHPLITEIYTNAMSSAHKNIENDHLTKVNLEFTDEVIEFIVLVELLNDFCNIKACNILKLDSAVSTLLNRYSDELFARVIKAKDYPFSVITMLEKKLNEKGISNRCRDIYCKIHNCAISVERVKQGTTQLGCFHFSLLFVIHLLKH